MVLYVPPLSLISAVSRDGQRLDSSCKIFVDHQPAAVLYPNRTGVSGFLSFVFLSENQPLAAGHHDCAPRH